MSIDYEAVFGIGIEVSAEYDDEYLDKILSDPEYGDFEHKFSGDCYTGLNPRRFIFLKEPFNEGVEGLSDKICRLQKLVEKFSLISYGEVGLLGDILCI